MRKKFGLKSWNSETDIGLLKELFEVMEESEADYTNTFRNLAKITESSTVEQLKLNDLT